MLKHLSLFMDFFSCIAQFFEQEHFNQAVLAKEIGNRLKAELGEQIAVDLVFDEEILRDHAFDHFSHGWRRNLHSGRNLFVTNFFMLRADFIDALEVIFFIRCHRVLFSSLLLVYQKKSKMAWPVDRNCLGGRKMIV